MPGKKLLRTAMGVILLASGGCWSDGSRCSCEPPCCCCPCSCGSPSITPVPTACPTPPPPPTQGWAR